MTKLIDRCHNVSSMAGTFSKEKLVSYIDETREYVLPLLRRAKLQYPEYSDALFAIKYHMVSVVDSVDAAIQEYESEGIAAYIENINGRHPHCLTYEE